MNKNKCEACKERKERIYICSPLRPKAQEPERAEIELKDNLGRAKAACRLVAKLGAVPLCSHLFCTQFLDDAVADERKIGRRIGLELLKDADELWCFSEYISEGMMEEIALASKLGIPVRTIGESAGLLGKASGKKCCDRQEPCGAEGTEDADIEIGIPLCGVQDAMEAVKKLLEVIFGDGMTGTDKKGENGNE